MKFWGPIQPGRREGPHQKACTAAKKLLLGAAWPSPLGSPQVLSRTGTVGGCIVERCKPLWLCGADFVNAAITTIAKLFKGAREGTLNLHISLAHALHPQTYACPG